jgi:hypothetical protein
VINIDKLVKSHLFRWDFSIFSNNIISENNYMLIEKVPMQENVNFRCGGRVSRARPQSPRHCVPAGPSARAVPAEVAASTPINRNRFQLK